MRNVLSLVTLLFCYLVAFAFISPGFSDGYVNPEGSEARKIAYPYRVHKKDTKMVIDTTMHLNTPHATSFLISPISCLDQLIINGKSVEDGVPFCSGTRGKNVNLKGYVHAGENDVSMVIRNKKNKGFVQVKPSTSDPIVFGIHIAFILALLVIVAGMMREKVFGKISYWFVSVIGIGALLRIIYFCSTSYYRRAYDVSGHIEYLIFIMTKWAVPISTDGWQFYQPPMYYLFSAIFSLPAQFLGSLTLVLDVIKFGSLLISLGAFGAIVWCAFLVFPKRVQSASRVLFVGALAVLPGLIFMSSRLSNDTLLFLLWILSLCYVIRFWQKGKERDWYVSVLFICVGILTKSSALTILPVLALCLVFHPSIKRERKYKLAGLSLLIILVSVGWFYALRFAVEGNAHIIGNVEGNNPKILLTEWRPYHLFMFRPHEVVMYPFTSSWRDEFGRHFFLEYLVKSTFSGGWVYSGSASKLSQILHIINIPLLLLMICGFFADIKRNWKENLPMWLTLLVLLGASGFMIANTKVSVVQDFRLVPLIALPVTFYVVKGIELLPGKWVIAGKTLLIAFMCINVVLILRLCFS
jgi:hypothetical protein